MIEIQIAGAGAGKTYNLSERIIKFHQENVSHKIIYAITYTNAAKRKISDEVIKKLGHLPEQVRIETVHSFFLHEIIYPYSHYTIAEVYNNAVSYNLPSEPAYKNRKLSLLKEKKIIHNDSVFKKAMLVIDRTNSKHGNKIKRAKVDLVNSHIAAKISHIFIDEAQDLDGDALLAFKILGDNAITIYMIGDPKQAIKFPKAFRDFIRNCEAKQYILHPNNNVTKRVPQEILKLSNAFCFAEEEQVNSEGKVGKVGYIKSTNTKYHEIVNHYKVLGSLIYIEEKQGCYNTHSNRGLFLPLSVEDKLISLAHRQNLDGHLFIAAIMSEIIERLKISTAKQIILWLTGHCNIRLEPQEYAELISNLQQLLSTATTASHVVSSIEAVKGLESQVCIFILNQSMYDYLTQSIPQTNHHNKNWNKVYVALTRTCDELIFAVDTELFSRTDITEIENYFHGRGIVEITEI